MSIENLGDTITPKSDQLNADDLLTGAITVTVTNVSRGAPDQPVSVHIDGGRQPYKPCKSMRRVLISLWGDNGKSWIGKSMTLYCDPSVKFGGVQVGGIRISHMSDIASDTQLMITTTRGKKSPVMIKKLSGKPEYPAEKFNTNKAAWYASISTGKTTIDALVGKMSEQYTVPAWMVDELKQMLVEG